MANIRDLVATLGISREEAENILAVLGAKEKTKELMEMGVAYKNLDNVEAKLENLSRDELKALYVEVGRLLKARKAEGKKILLTYQPNQGYSEKSGPYVSPLDKSLQEGIEDILATKREVKQKAVGYRSFEDMHSVADDIAAIEEVRFRKTKGKSGRWSGPPIELSCEESIRLIERWRREHGQR